jgi:DNA-directed RNA polymerase specialized sigma24 family protein
MSWSLESQLELFEPRERRLLLKKSALYADWFTARVLGANEPVATTGEEILGLTLTKIVEGCDGYAFKDGDILFFHYLCRCCRRTVLSLYRSAARTSVVPVEAEDDTPLVLTEQAAARFLERRQSLEQFLAFVRDKKLRGKLRAYAGGFPRYGMENWGVEQIAKDLRVTPPTIGTYRSQLRQFLEEFELQRTRWRQS